MPINFGILLETRKRCHTCILGIMGYLNALVSFLFLFLFPCSELNDTVVEAEIRTREAKPLFPTKEAIESYLRSNNRLVILVCFYQNSTLVGLFLVQEIVFAYLCGYPRYIFLIGPKILLMQCAF